MVQNIIRPETDQVVILNVRPFAMSPYSTLGAMPIVDMSGIVTDLDDLFEDEYSTVEKRNKVASHDLIRTCAALLMKAGIKCRGVALRGDIRDEIVFKVDQIKADMLIIGSRGITKYLLYSYQEWVHSKEHSLEVSATTAFTTVTVQSLCQKFILVLLLALRKNRKCLKKSLINSEFIRKQLANI